ncbi:MAG: YggS family pyridoxal phosphate-dependent enzyme [Desulfobacterales bacterium]|nr:MAG: YggS family pyridoxal phosphate-dependent enzyme [Desulfobacterales bacterium]
MDSIKERLENVKDRIKKAAEACNRNPLTIRLVAVSKTVPADRVREAIEAGVKNLGENYVQEAREKINSLTDFPVNWHFIGHLQTNKAKYAVRLFDLIHSVDSLKLSRELNKQAQKNGKIQQILIQVNISREETKSGISVDEAINLVDEISHLENLSIKGLMTMPPYFNQPERVRPFFSALRELSDQIKEKAIPNMSMDELSMGMTGDFEAAIEEGATMVRVGTAIFGERK